MKLRHRLFLFSTAQLAVFGALFLVAYLAFQRSVVPLFEDLLREKNERVTMLVARELDVPLGAQDRALVAAAVAAIQRDPDLAYIVVHDSTNDVMFTHGVSPKRDPFAAKPNTATIHDGRIATWGEVSLEGIQLGKVAVVFSTERMDTLDTWAQRIAIIVTLLWLGALAYSMLFARSFVTPIRAMMTFSRKVAGGELSERIATRAPSELGELCDYLNEMTADLERRERERKIAAAAVESMQRELLSVSRMAGMAEIATGVLHNVGNVLNSLNVSVSVIGDRVRNSRVGALAKSVELFEGFPGGLPAFLATDKGKVLPSYLTTVSKRLAEENASVLGELASVDRNVEHIKAIVTMQQTYARPSGVSESIVLTTLIDDALRLGEASFAKHGIEVVRDYQTAITVNSDRHKLLQILINLISNARHALKNSPDGPQQLIVRVRTVQNVLEIVIEDTGIGIPAENLEKIFVHGFTTKEGGHGFGLHASANTARELGGSLRVASGGIGCGATFTVEIPLDQPARAHDHN
ncbi:MAG: ATP-binding protein [Myxococcota bacterium]|nr:HAMP domain-containing protein [Deltaproteobacteria bacterium]MDQ3337332.1 ATP-binding protein [Myxococcota bacterium]